MCASDLEISRTWLQNEPVPLCTFKLTHKYTTGKHRERERERDREREKEREREREIGRAACRERVEIVVGGGALKKKEKR